MMHSPKNFAALAVCAALSLAACESNKPSGDTPKTVAPSDQAAASGQAGTGHNKAAEPTLIEPKPAAPAQAADPNAAAAVPPSKADAAMEAKIVFAQRCQYCHGESGKGNGPAAATLTPRPRDYSDAKWQASVTDDALRDVIIKGGAATGKSMMMPANPDLQEKPELVDELVRKIRSFKK